VTSGRPTWKNAATIDEQMMGAIEPSATIPQWYGPATRTTREEAAKLGIDPREFQGTGWAGLKGLSEAPKTVGGKYQGPRVVQGFDYEGPMINHINRSIETTHRLTGMPRHEVVRRGVVLKEIPMYGIGAGLFGARCRQEPSRDHWSC
jgi:hypothetical protein